jgi:hypothetical protein
MMNGKARQNVQGYRTRGERRRIEIVVGIWTSPNMKKENADVVVFVFLCAGCVWAGRGWFGGEEHVSQVLERRVRMVGRRE